MIATFGYVKGFCAIILPTFVAQVKGGLDKHVAAPKAGWWFRVVSG